MRAGWVLIALALLTGCGSEAPRIMGGEGDAGTKLDEQAVAAGILPDHADVKFAGRYEVQSDLGTDKFCAVSESGGNFRIGMLAVFGPDSKCEGRGSASVRDEKILIALDGEGDCTFEADFDGNELRFPGQVPRGCAGYCSPRASMSGTSYFLVEQGDDKARKTLGRDIERLCD